MGNKGSTVSSNDIEEDKREPAGSAGGASPVIMIDESRDSTEKLIVFLNALPKNAGISFVVTHPDRSELRHLTGLIRDHTGLPVVEVDGPTAIDNDSIYVIPEGNHFSVRERVISFRRAVPGKDSEKKEQEGVDQETELRSNVLARINEAVISINNDNAITFFNQAAEKLYGISAKEALGSRLDDICHSPLLPEEEGDRAGQTLERTGEWKGENTHRTADGKRLHVESSVSLVKDSKGRVIGKQAIIHDITERKELEIALREKDDMLTEALDSAGMFAFEWEPETDEVIRTPNSGEILGIRKNPARSSSERYFSRIHPEDRASFTGMIKKLSPSNPVYTASYRLKRKDTGKYIVIGEKGQAHFDEQGKMIRLSGMAADITRRKHLEEELERQKELFGKLIDNIPVMLVIYDPGMETFTFNRELERVLGWTERDAQKGDFMEKVYPDPDYRKDVEDYMCSLEPGWRDFMVTAKDGSVVESSWSNIKLSDDRQVGIGIDVRRSREARRVLRRDKKKLEELVREKSREMLRIQIEIDRENRLAELGELAASVAHELRNPLATINISAFNLKKKIRGQDRLKHLARIKRKIEEANLIIDNLLSYSRLKPPRKEDCSLYRKISEVAGEILENRRIDRGKLKLDIDPLMDITILADPHQIGEILANLLNNAFNAIAETGGRVIVRGCVRDENAEVIVDDNGVGIEPEDLERIFDPFFSTRPNGTGLGLPICRQIIRGHGGSIEIDSEKGEGTSVKLSIPVSE